MHVYINSEYRELPNTVNTVSKLIKYLQLPTQGTGVAINNHLILARNWDGTSFKDDDRIVIISATYGG